MIFVLVTFFVAIEAVFTALEIALGAIPRARWRTLAEEAREAERDAHGAVDTRRAQRSAVKAASLDRLTEHPERLSLLFISTTTLALWSAASLLTGMALRQQWAWWVLGAAFVLVLFAAEVLPLLIAAQYSDVVALGLANPVMRLLRALRPVMMVPNVLGTGMARLLGARPEASTQVTTNELRTALAAAEEEGVIESEERAMLEGAIAFREKPVSTVMTYLEDVVSICEDDDLATVLRVSLENGHSRLPVFTITEPRDTIRGVLATKDLLRPLRNGPGVAFAARDVMRTAFFLTAETPIASALEQLRHERTLMAVVTRDDRPVGIVTLEDLLEELVGEIEDEWDDEPALRVEMLAAPGREKLIDASNPYVIVCDRPHEVTIREVERFWRENGDSLLRLRTVNGELAPADETLDDYAERYLTQPHEGAKIVVGEARQESEVADEEDEDNDAAKAETSATVADVVLEVRTVLEDRIHFISLSEIARSLETRSGKKEAVNPDAHV